MIIPTPVFPRRQTPLRYERHSMFDDDLSGPSSPELAAVVRGAGWSPVGRRDDPDGDPYALAARFLIHAVGEGERYCGPTACELECLDGMDW